MLYIINAQQVIVEGTVQANGAAGTSTIGAGSGGTVRIFTDILEGSGSVQVVGGNGGSSTGGGGGGRLQIKYDDVHYWFGDFQAEGGTGYTSGGAGTVYLEVGHYFKCNMSHVLRKPVMFFITQCNLRKMISPQKDDKAVPCVCILNSFFKAIRAVHMSDVDIFVLKR